MSGASAPPGEEPRPPKAAIRKNLPPRQKEPQREREGRPPVPCPDLSGRRPRDAPAVHLVPASPNSSSLARLGVTAAKRHSHRLSDARGESDFRIHAPSAQPCRVAWVIARWSAECRVPSAGLRISFFEFP